MNNSASLTNLEPRSKQHIYLNKFYLFLFLLIISLGLDTPSFAQSFNFRHYGTNEGLPSSEVYQAFQDSKGYIWFATNFGVSRYDGYKFENFDNKDGLPDNTVLEIYEDFKGRIWFISISAQLSYFKNDKIVAYEHNKEMLETIKDRPAITNKSFHVDSLDNVYIGINYKGMYKVTPKGTVYKPYQINPAKVKSHFIRIDNNNKGFYEYTDCPDLTIIKKNDTLFFPSSFFLRQAVGSGLRLFNFNKIGEFLFFHTEDILIIHNFREKTYEKISIKKRIISSLLDNSKNLWIGTSNGGVLYFPEGNVLKNPTHNYLSNESVSSILEDNEHGFWFTTLNNGVFYIPSDKFHSYTSENGLSDNIHKTITSDCNGTIITATGINKILNFIKDTIKLQKAPINDEIIFSIFFRKSDNSLWFGTNRALYKTTLNKLSDIKSYELNNQSYTVNEIIESTNGNIWFATNMGVFELKDEKLTQFIYTKPFFRVAAIEEVFPGNIWLGTQNGLFVLQNGKLSFKGELHKALSKKITALKKCYSDSSLWIATKGNGIVILKDNKTTELSVKDGLSSNFITCLFADNNTIWAGTNKGLDKIVYEPSKKNKFIIEHFNQTKGIISNEINKIYVLNKHVYVLTNMGITVFNSNEVSPNMIPPPVNITGIKILNKDTAVLKNYDLTYDQNFLSISFNGLTFKNPGNVSFKFKLTGLSDKWQFTNTPIIQYQYIPPGDYSFEIYALNEDGVMSTKPAVFTLTIHSPFWKTWWFILLIALLFIGSVFSIYKYRLNEIRIRQKLKEELNKYIQQALTKQMNPHFIFNSLNSIQNYILENDKRQSSKYLSKFAKLMRLILENSQKPSISLSQELSAIRLYLELESMRFNGKFSYAINISESINQEIEIPALLIQPYIENAIWHGIMHKPEQYGTVITDFRVEQNYLLCTITDDGIGRKKSSEINAERRKNHKSYGTEITEKRLQAYNSLYGTRVGIDYIDLTDENNNPKGTSVKIKIYIKTV